MNDVPAPALDERTMALLDQMVEEHARRKVEKRCPRCHTIKPLSEFHRARSRPDGVQFCCSACWNARLEEKKAAMGSAGRRLWEHQNYMHHRRRNVRRHWVYFNRRRLVSPELYIEDVDREKVFARDNGLCGICAQPIDPSLPPHHGDSFTIDHIKPIRDRGEHSYANVRAAHLRCNVREWNRLSRLGRAAKLEGGATCRDS